MARGRRLYGYVHLGPEFGAIQFSAAAYTASEGDAFATITVQRVGGANGRVTVDYATSNGTATAGLDYVATSGTLTWLDGESDPQTFTVPIIADAVTEANETVILTLSNATRGASLGTPSTAVLTINDVPVPVVQFSSPAYVQPVPASFVGDIPVTLPVTRTGSLAAVTVRWTTTLGTTGMLTFPANDSSAQNIVLDLFSETVDWRVFSVTLSNAAAVPAFPAPIIAVPVAQVSVTPEIYTSRPYPVVVVEGMDASGALSSARLLTAPIDAMDVSLATLDAGTITTILRSYAMLPEGFDIGLATLDAGTITTILRSYAMAAEGMDISQASLDAGTLNRILVTTSMLPEGLDVAQAVFTGGTLA